MRRVLVFAVSLLALAACGPKVQVKSDGSAVIHDKDGSTIAYNTGGGVKAPPAHMPPYLKIFPGAQIKSTIDTGKSGGMLSMETAATPEAVVDYYKKEAATAGLEVQMDMNNEGGHSVLFAEPREKGKRNFNVTASKQGGDKTVVVMTYNEQA